MSGVDLFQQLVIHDYATVENLLVQTLELPRTTCSAYEFVATDKRKMNLKFSIKPILSLLCHHEIFLELFSWNSFITT